MPLGLLQYESPEVTNNINIDIEKHCKISRTHRIDYFFKDIAVSGTANYNNKETDSKKSNQ